MLAPTGQESGSNVFETIEQCGFEMAEAATGECVEQETEEMLPEEELEAAYEECGNPDLWLYRDRTIGLLKRYTRLSVEVGRLPSLLGREIFRSRVTAYHMMTFADGIIFVRDVERSLEKLDGFEKQVITRVILQGYTQDQAAPLLGCGARKVNRALWEAVDRISEFFLAGGLLREIPTVHDPCAKSCQEGNEGVSPLSDSEIGRNIF